MNEQIAQSLAAIQKLYADDLAKRDLAQQEAAAERLEWKNEMNERKLKAEKWEAQSKDRARIAMPRLPWQMQLFWATAYLLLLLSVLALAWHLFGLVVGRST